MSHPIPAKFDGAVMSKRPAGSRLDVCSDADVDCADDECLHSVCFSVNPRARNRRSSGLHKRLHHPKSFGVRAAICSIHHESAT
jgi:hypothetical protein